MGYLQFSTALLSSSLCALAAKTCNVSSLRTEPATSLLQIRFKETPTLPPHFDPAPSFCENLPSSGRCDPALPSPKKKSNTTDHPKCRTSARPAFKGYSYCYSKQCDEQGSVENLIQSDCESVGGTFTGKHTYDCGKNGGDHWWTYAGFCEPAHVPEKCLTRKSFFSSKFSVGNCCAPFVSTQTAACLDGYKPVWKKEKCGFGADFDANAAAEGSAAMSMFDADAWASLTVGQRTFECIPTLVNDNGRPEKGMPGTEHRRRWKYNKALDGETGSCCGLLSCNSCSESHSIRRTNQHCGFGQNRICASQHL